MISEAAYEHLRQILEKQHERSFTPEEVKEIGDELLSFCMLLVSIADRIHTDGMVNNYSPSKP
ncbi:MAG TPA: hypothetical protein VMR45_04820 [Patescibacteria group bacterium]|nr:hypothetical protein [Patescibacteria group bacterium]